MRTFPYRLCFAALLGLAAGCQTVPSPGSPRARRVEEARKPPVTARAPAARPTTGTTGAPPPAYHPPVPGEPPPVRRAPPPVLTVPTNPPAARPPPVKPPPPAAGIGPLSFRETLALQTFLDRQNFSPGCLDGKMGGRTRDAVRAWQMARGLPGTGEIDRDALRRLGEQDEAFTVHVVSEDERAALTFVPESWRERSQAPHLGYQTILEGVAERYHASEAAIRLLNPGVSWPDPPAGTSVVAPNPGPSVKPTAGKIMIQLGRKRLLAYDARGRIVAVFPCSIAGNVEKRPVGELKVVNCASNPVYTFDPALFAEDPEASSIPQKLIIPSGPNNPVGVAWLSLDRPGYGIHGTPKPEDIGKTESHGCFRLANWNARKLLDMISIGTPVIVTP